MISESEIQEIISATEAIKRGLMLPGFAKDWPMVAISKDGAPYAMRIKRAIAEGM